MESTLQCNYTRIPKDQQNNHIENAKRLFEAVSEVKVLQDGYAFRLPSTEQWFLQAAAFINLERLCCPFYHFRLEVEANNAAIWLSLSGEHGVKTLLTNILGGHINKSLLEQFFNTDNDKALKTQLLETASTFPTVIE